MAKFIINKTMQSPKTVEAEHYRLESGFFNFYESHRQDANTVYTYAAEKVLSIERATDSE